MYNKNQYRKYNDKKVLHKVKKQWVTISLALLMMIGGGAIATHVSASADVNNNTQPVAAVKAPAKRMAKKAAPVSSSASTNQPSSARINQMSVYGKYNNDTNELDSAVTGSYGKVNWTPSMMNAYTAIVVASDENYKEASAFNTNSTASNAANSLEYSMASSAASSANLNVDYELSAFASNYPSVESHMEHEPLVQSYLTNSVYASANMRVLDMDTGLNQRDLKPFASLSNAYQSDSNQLNTNRHFITDTIYGVNNLTNGTLKYYINGLNNILSYQSDMSHIGSEASLAYDKLPASQKSAAESTFANSISASNSSSASASASATSAVMSESASADHLTNAQIQLSAYSAIDSYSIKEYGTPDVLADEIHNDAIAEKDTAINLNSESASNKVASASDEASTSSAINSYLATLNGDTKTNAENIISGMNTISAINSATSSSLSKYISSSASSVVASASREAVSESTYSSSFYNSLDNSYAVSAYDKSTGNYEMMTQSLQNYVVSNFNNSLLANNAITDAYDYGDIGLVRDSLLASGANLYYNSVKNSTMAKYPAAFTPTASSSASSSTASGSTTSSSTSSNTSSEASSSANSSVSSQSSNQSSATSQNSNSSVAPSSEQSSDNNTDNIPFIPSFNVPTTPLAPAASSNPAPAVTPTQNTTVPTNNNSSNNSSSVVPSVEPQNTTDNNKSVNNSTKPTVNKHHNNHVARNHHAKHESLYLFNTDFKGLSKRNHSVVTTKGVRAYKRTRKGRYVPVMNIKPNTRLAVKRVIKFGKITKLQLTNGLLVTANKHFVSVKNLAKRVNKRTAKRAIKGINASRYTRALRKSNYVLRHGRRHAKRYIYRTAEKFTKANNAEKKAYRKFAHKHTNRNRKAVNKAITNLNNLVTALLK